MIHAAGYLSRYAGEVEARSAEGEGAANCTVLLAAEGSTVPLAAPSPGAARRVDPLRGSTPRSGRA